MLTRAFLSILLVCVLAGCSPSGGSDSKLIQIIPAGDRGASIQLSGVDLSGVTYSLPASSDGATVINVWSSICGPCREEAPLLREIASRSPRNAAFVGINVRESGRDQARRFEEKFRIPYPSVYDPAGKSLLRFQHSVPYSAVPSTIVLDPQMRIGAVILGAVPSEQTLVDVIDSVLDSR